MLAAQKSNAEMWTRTGRPKPLTWRAMQRTKGEWENPCQTSENRPAAPSTFPRWSTPIRVADPMLFRLGTITGSGQDVVKFSEHFPLALSIRRYHSRIGAWQGSELTCIKPCMSWSRLDGSVTVTSSSITPGRSVPAPMTPVRNFQVSAHFFITIACPAWTRKAWHLGRGRNGQSLPLSASCKCQFGFSLNISKSWPSRLAI